MLLQPGSRPVPDAPDYKLIRKLGAGAFGEVWHAHGPGGLSVALKFIRLSKRILASELRSLEVMKTVRHPNLVSLFGAWLADAWLILAMELCDRTLEDRLEEALAEDLPGIPHEELLCYMSDAANGLDALNKHAQHRDVKPANLLLVNSGVKVSDFGLAKALEQTIASNSGAGTVAYLAPECFKGQLAQQSDQYSLAVTYYHLRTGRLLFGGNHAQMMYAHLEAEPELSPFPPTERAVLARALAKEPAKRWQSCKGFVKELTDARNPTTLSMRQENATFFLKRGENRYLQREFAIATKYFDQAIRLEPTNAHYYTRRGAAWGNRRMPDKAIDDYDTAIRLDPNHALAYCNRGNIHYELKAYDNGKKDFEAAIRLDSNQVCFYRKFAWRLATCADARGRNGKHALDLAATACDLTKWSNCIDLTALAAAQAEVGEYARAADFQERAYDDLDAGQAGGDYYQLLRLYKSNRPYREPTPNARGVESDKFSVESLAGWLIAAAGKSQLLNPRIVAACLPDHLLGPGDLKGLLSTIEKNEIGWLYEISTIYSDDEYDDDDFEHQNEMLISWAPASFEDEFKANAARFGYATDGMTLGILWELKRSGRLRFEGSR